MRIQTRLNYYMYLSFISKLVMRNTNVLTILTVWSQTILHILMIRLLRGKKNIVQAKMSSKISFTFTFKFVMYMILYNLHNSKIFYNTFIKYSSIAYNYKQ